MFSRRALQHLNHGLIGLKRCASTSTLTTAIKTNDAAITKKEEAPVAQQAPNYATTWSTSQRPRPGPASGPRFEQTAMNLQPNPLSAMQLVAEEPIRLVQGRKAVCDGGGGPLGHPKIYINLVRPMQASRNRPWLRIKCLQCSYTYGQDQPGPRACGYWYVSSPDIGDTVHSPGPVSCSGVRFEQDPHHHHH